VNFESPPDKIRDFIKNTSKNLDEKVFGHANAKRQVLRLLCQWITKPDSKGMVIGIQGPMGCGKTTLVKNGICNTISLPFAFIPLGGASGSDYLDGHGFTYEGSTWGKLVQSLMDSKCMNPVIFFDELDKVSGTSRGEEIINYLVHLTDSSQNDKVNDKYFAQLPLDLSKALIIFSYNDESNVNPILRDRMYKIYTEGYTPSEKVSLFKDYLLPEILSEFSLEKGKILFTDSVVKYLVDNLEKEEGVRNLKRALHEIIGQVNVRSLMEDDFKLPYTVTQTDIKDYVKNNKKKEDKFMNPMYV
jgi:ATP-dependent Lon protease